jgi:hypothetical protein
MVQMNFIGQLKLIAAQKELGYQSLLKLYIGEGLRRDLTEIRRDHLIAKTLNVLKKPIPDEKKSQRSGAILKKRFNELPEGFGSRMVK